MAKKLINTAVKLGTGTLLDESVNDLIEVENLTLLGSWTTSSGWGSPKAYKLGKLIVLSGYVTGGLESQNILRLPISYRPDTRIRFNTASASQTLLLEVNADGYVYCVSGTATNTNNIYLDGIIFFTS